MGVVSGCAREALQKFLFSHALILCSHTYLATNCPASEQVGHEKSHVMLSALLVVCAPLLRFIGMASRSKQSSHNPTEGREAFQFSSRNQWRI